MSSTVDSLILDLLEWIGPNARPYAEVMEAWRTSCPRLPVWEEATERGFIVRHFAPGRETVAVTALGVEHVRTHRRREDDQAAGEARMRGMRQDRRPVGAPADVSDLRRDALLRQLAEPAHHEARPRDRTSRGRISRAGGALAVLLPG